MTLFLTENDVDRLADMPLALEAVKEAFRELAAGRAHNVPRTRARAPGVVLHSMGAAAEYLNLAGWKEYATSRGGVTFHVGLYDSTSSELVALMQANRLGQLRTGAATGVAAEHLALPEAREAGLFGAGWQAESQLEAIAAVRPLERCFVYSRTEEKRTAFAEKMSQRLDIEVTPVEKPRGAVEGLPIVVTATSSRTPVFDGEWLSEGALVCAVGGNWLKKAEVDVTAIRRAQRIICDSIAACQNEAGEFVPAIEQNAFDWPQAVELADVVAGNTPGRSAESEIVLFKSVGLAIEDVALGAKVLERAKEQGVGRELAL